MNKYTLSDIFCAKNTNFFYLQIWINLKTNDYVAHFVCNYK